MKGPVLSACLAAALVLPASGVRAEPADCDLFCRLQGYLSADHMAAPQGSAAPPAAAQAKSRHHAAMAATKTPKPGLASASQHVPHPAAALKPPVEVAAKSPPRLPAESASRAMVREAADASTRPGPAKGLKALAAAPKPNVALVPPSEPPKHRTVVALAPPSLPARSEPAVAATPKQSRRIARRPPHVDRVQASRPVATTAELIPGSARLVPAEFQAFRAL